MAAFHQYGLAALIKQYLAGCFHILQRIHREARQSAYFIKIWSYHRSQWEKFALQRAHGRLPTQFKPAGCDQHRVHDQGNARGAMRQAGRYELYPALRGKHARLDRPDREIFKHRIELGQKDILGNRSDGKNAEGVLRSDGTDNAGAMHSGRGKRLEVSLYASTSTAIGTSNGQCTIRQFFG